MLKHWLYLNFIYLLSCIYLPNLHTLFCLSICLLTHIHVYYLLPFVILSLCLVWISAKDEPTVTKLVKGVGLPHSSLFTRVQHRGSESDHWAPSGSRVEGRDGGWGGTSPLYTRGSVTRGLKMSLRTLHFVTAIWAKMLEQWPEVIEVTSEVLQEKEGTVSSRAHLNLWVGKQWVQNVSTELPCPWGRWGLTPSYLPPRRLWTPPTAKE